MSAKRNSNILGSAALALLALAVTVPSTHGLFGETSNAQPLATLPVASLSAINGVDAAMKLSPEFTAALLADDGVTASDDAAPRPETAAAGPLDAETTCMAKVVHHEAANQPRDGQLAVAQLIMHRKELGRFASSVCGVVHQPGQFFNTNAYNPNRSDPRWATAVAVAREAMSGETAAVVPGAIFYHAAYQPAPRFFRSRQRVATLGDHIFYR
ncbi:cell wall hydrolase [Sphingomonas sp. 1P06PA]|uniref:cell wall hydrolase n=1 Tax=Sphingomonas sp. 1P06PA TaxID=554121 RepID=UPI0039A56846